MHLGRLDHVALFRGFTRIVGREGIALGAKEEGSVVTSTTGRFWCRSFHVDLVGGDSAMRADLPGSEVRLLVSEDEALGTVSRVILRLWIAQRLTAKILIGPMTRTTIPEAMTRRQNANPKLF